MAQPEPNQQEVPAQMSLMPLKKTTISLPLDLYKQLKIESAKRDMEMSTIVTDALRKHLSENENEQ
jgi:metal-responsive CopG/Arc/MetJ family transcriptional regulator